MALVVNPVSTLTISIMDRDRNIGQVEFKVAQDWAIGDVQAAMANTIVPAITALTDGVVVGWNLTRTAYEDAVVVAGESSDVERKGVFKFRAGRIPVKYEIPSIRNTLVVDFSEDAVIDSGNLAVQAFINLVTTGVLGVLRPATNRGEDINQFAGAYKRHRKSTKG